MRINDWLTEKVKGGMTRLEYAALILASILLLVLVFLVVSPSKGHVDGDEPDRFSIPELSDDSRLSRLPDERNERTSLVCVDKYWGALGGDTTAAEVLKEIPDDDMDILTADGFLIEDPENAEASEWPLVEVRGSGIERTYRRLYNNIMSASLADERYFGGVRLFVEIVIAAFFWVLFLLLLLVIVFKRFRPRRAVEVKPEDKACIRLYSPDPDKCIYPEQAIEDDLAFFLSSNNNVIVRGSKEYLTNVQTVLQRYSPAKKVVRVYSKDIAGSDGLSLLKKEYIDNYHDAVQYAEALFRIFRNEERYEKNEFFIKSAKLLMAECIWFLREYDDGIYCDFPHLVRFTLCLPRDYMTIFQRYPDSSRRTGFLKTAIDEYARDEFVGQVTDMNITLAGFLDDEIMQLSSNASTYGHIGTAVLVEDTDSVAMGVIEPVLSLLKSGVAELNHRKYVEAPDCFRNIRFRKSQKCKDNTDKGLGQTSEENMEIFHWLEDTDADIRHLISNLETQDESRDCMERNLARKVSEVSAQWTASGCEEMPLPEAAAGDEDFGNIDLGAAAADYLETVQEVPSEVKCQEGTKEFFLDIERLIEEDFPYPLDDDGHGPNGETGKCHMRNELKNGFINSYYFYNILKKVLWEGDERERKVASMTEQEKQDTVRNYMEKLDADYPVPTDDGIIMYQRIKLQDDINNLKVIDDKTYHSKLTNAIERDNRDNALKELFPDNKRYGMR